MNHYIQAKNIQKQKLGGKHAIPDLSTWLDFEKSSQPQCCIYLNVFYYTHIYLRPFWQTTYFQLIKSDDEKVFMLFRFCKS